MYKSSQLFEGCAAKSPKRGSLAGEKADERGWLAVDLAILLHQKTWDIEAVCNKTWEPIHSRFRGQFQGTETPRALSNHPIRG
jgi:hypothetical protein